MVSPVNTSNAYLSARGIVKQFDDTLVLRGIDLDVQRGETICLLGPSGCGKTTLLRIIAGLEQADEGQLWFGGQEITSLPPYRRDFGLMFQDYALFPHLSVADNIAFGLQMKRLPKTDIEKRVQELLVLVDLDEYGSRKVYELSGGQRQRVALARSLAPEPRLLMLDEPLGSLDRILRDQLLTELRQLLQRLQQTALYVTHDQMEAFAIADHVVLMNKGEVEQAVSPSDMYLHPATPFVAQFLGFKNILPATVVKLHPAFTLETPIGTLFTVDNKAGIQIGESLTIAIRPEAARIIEGEHSPDQNLVQLQLIHGSFRGAHTMLVMRSSLDTNTILEFEVPGVPVSLAPGNHVSAWIDPSAIVVLREDRDSSQELAIG